MNGLQKKGKNGLKRARKNRSAICPPSQHDTEKENIREGEEEGRSSRASQVVTPKTKTEYLEKRLRMQGDLLLIDGEARGHIGRFSKVRERWQKGRGKGKDRDFW